MYSIVVEFDSETEEEKIMLFDWFEDAEECFRTSRKENDCRICFYEIEANTNKVIRTIAQFNP